MFRHVLSFASVLGLALTLTACGNGEPPQQLPRPVMVVHPQPASEARESYPGEVHARYEPELAFRIGGKVVERLVEAGDRVRKTNLSHASIRRTCACSWTACVPRWPQRKPTCGWAKAEYDRYQALLGRQLVSQSQFDNADNAYRAATARLQQARAEFDVASNQVDYAVRATRDGLIAQRRIEVGQVVAAGQTAFVLAADGEREVAIDLPEQSLERYRVGQEVEVELWSQPGRQYRGQIRELSPAADAQRTYSARVAFTEQEVPAELGQSALVSIRRDGDVALAVPLSALSAEQGRAYVWRLRPDSTVERVEVRTGAFGEQLVPVLEGLAADDWIVLAGGQMLSDNQPVRPVDRHNRPVELAAQE